MKINKTNIYMRNYALISDIDGILTDGGHWYDSDKKRFRRFGSNEKDALHLLDESFFDIKFVTASDPSMALKFLEGTNYSVHQCKDKRARQELIDGNRPAVYIGDEMDMPESEIVLALKDSTPQAKSKADYILSAEAGKNVFPTLLDELPVISQMEEWIQQLIDRVVDKGKTILLAGVGKNWHLSRLIASFYQSFGIRAMAMDIPNALHGDLGFISDSDVLIITSKSGKTEEIRKFVNYLISGNHIFKEDIFGITCEQFDFIDEINQLVIDQYYDETEVAPMLSTEGFLKYHMKTLKRIYRCAGIGADDYILNHPGGEIGKMI